MRGSAPISYANVSLVLFTCAKRKLWKTTERCTFSPVWDVVTVLVTLSVCLFFFLRCTAASFFSLPLLRDIFFDVPRLQVSKGRPNVSAHSCVIFSSGILDKKCCTKQGQLRFISTADSLLHLCSLFMCVCVCACCTARRLKLLIRVFTVAFKEFEKWSSAACSLFQGRMSDNVGTRNISNQLNIFCRNIRCWWVRIFDFVTRKALHCFIRWSLHTLTFAYTDQLSVEGFQIVAKWVNVAASRFGLRDRVSDALMTVSQVKCL